MKKCLILLLLLVLAACGAKEAPDTDTNTADTNIIEGTPTPSPDPTNEPTYQPTSQPTTEPEPEPTPEPHVSSIPLDGIASYFAELEAVLEADGGALWGVPLHMPFIFYDPDTRHVVASRQDTQGVLVPQEGVYVGVLPRGAFIDYPSVQFGGLQWVMMYSWNMPDFQSESTDPVGAMVRQTFELFKSQLFGQRHGSNDFAYLNRVELRTLLRVEMNALLAALQDEDEESRMETIRTALSIRAHRRSMMTPQAVFNENDIVIEEGLSPYTTMLLRGDSVDEIVDVIKRNMPPDDEFVQNLHLTSAYYMGLMYALLLDAVGAVWRHNVAYYIDMGDFLAHYTGIDELIPIDELDMERFGYSTLSEAELGWVAFREDLVDRAQTLFADGVRPVLWMRSEGRDVITDAVWLDVTRLGPTRTGSVFYGTFTFESEFGVLRGENTLRITDWFDMSHATRSFGISAVDMRIDGNRVTGHGWEIELNEGYVIMMVYQNTFFIRRE